MSMRRCSLVLCCVAAAVLLTPGIASSQASPPIDATLAVHAGNNSIGDGPGSFQLDLVSLDSSTHLVDIRWRLLAENGSQASNLSSTFTVTTANSEIFWNHTLLTEGFWTAHATISPNGSDEWEIALSADLVHLSPAEIVVLPSATWDVLWSPAGGGASNSTPASGDDVAVRIRVENLGDAAANLTWTIAATIDGAELENATGSTAVAGGGRVLVGPLSLESVPEGTISLSLTGNTSTQAWISATADLGVSPPPLASIDTHLITKDRSIILNIWNNGTATGQIDTFCSHDSLVLIDGQSVTIFAGELVSVVVSTNLADGEYACSTNSSARVHTDSSLNSELTVNSSGPFWSLLSTPIAVDGPRHASDRFELRAPVENSGGGAGYATLRLTVDANSSSGAAIYVPPGSTEVLSSSLTLPSAGSIAIIWQIVDVDSASIHQQGGLNLTVLPPQTLALGNAEITSTSPESHELAVIVTLDQGASRVVEFEVASGGTIRHYSEQEIHPGTQIVLITTPFVESEEELLVAVHQQGWGSGTLHALSVQVATSLPEAEITILGGWPEQALPGDVLMVQAEFINSGETPLTEGHVRVKRSTDGFLLAEQEIPALDVGGSVTYTVQFNEWPSGPGGTVVWEYRTSNGVEHDHQMILTLPRQNAVPSKSISDDVEIRDVQVGAALGAIGIALIAIGRAVSRSPSSLGRQNNNASIAPERAEPAAEREVQCPSCDQRLTVPTAYSGRARCTRCGEVFSAAASDVEDAGSTELESEAETEAVDAPQDTEHAEAAESPSTLPVSSSDTEIIECPSCTQSLRVPIERRPAKARCPACSTTFMATVE